jgi:hypothetical protein
MGARDRKFRFIVFTFATFHMVYERKKDHKLHIES